MEYSYYLTLKRRKNEGELLFNVGSIDKTTTLMRLKGGTTNTIFEHVISTLSRAGCVTPIETGNPSTYWVRDDVGPVLGTYLILIRRSRNLDYWLNFFDELLTGKYSKLGAMFASLLVSAIDLSRHIPKKSKKRVYDLSPLVLSSLSSALKTFVKSLKKYEPKTTTEK